MQPKLSQYRRRRRRRGRNNCSPKWTAWLSPWVPHPPSQHPHPPQHSHSTDSCSPPQLLHLIIPRDPIQHLAQSSGYAPSVSPTGPPYNSDCQLRSVRGRVRPASARRLGGLGLYGRGLRLPGRSRRPTTAKNTISICSISKHPRSSIFAT